MVTFYYEKSSMKVLSDETFAVQTVKNILYAKICNGKSVLMRSARNQKKDLFKQDLYVAAQKLSDLAQKLDTVDSIDSMRGIEGAAATIYFFTI